MNQPTLHTARLLLRPASAADLPALLALWREPAVGRYLLDGDVPTQAQAAQRLAAHLDAARDGLGLWLLHPHAAATVLGCVTLRRRPQGELEPAVALHPAHTGLGLAHEALGALLAHAGRLAGAASLVAHACVPDTAADRLLRGLGFVACYECDGGRYRVRQYRAAAEPPPAPWRLRAQRTPRRRAISRPIAVRAWSSSSRRAAG